jgi:hypothetical protein
MRVLGTLAGNNVCGHGVAAFFALHVFSLSPVSPWTKIILCRIYQSATWSLKQFPRMFSLQVTVYFSSIQMQLDLNPNGRHN